MSNPKVSIVIPVYKAEKYIERCVRSLFEQTLNELEFIFVDDFSPDDSINILNKILDFYPLRKGQVKIIRHSHNQGVSQSRQDGLSIATGDFVIHCDPDDWVEKDMYERLYTHAIKSNADLVFCDYIMETGKVSRIESQSLESLNKDDIIFALCSGKIYGSCWNKLVSRVFIEKNNIKFIEGLNVCEDLFFFLQLLKLGPSVSYLNKPLYHYDFIINPNSIQRISLPNHIAQDEKIISLANEYLDTNTYENARQSLISGALFHIFTIDQESDSNFVSKYGKYYDEKIKKYLPFQNRIFLNIAFSFSKTFSQKLLSSLKRLKKILS